MAQAQAAGSTGTTKRSAPKAQSKTKSVSKLVTQLLTGAKHLDYEDIAAQVRRRIPDAQTSARSVASLATGLRAAGIDLPDRRMRDARH